MAPDRKLNLGCGQHPKDGYWNVDVAPGPGVDAVWDLQVTPWPETWARSESADEIYMSQVLEHIWAIDRVEAEIYRVLRPGGILHATVPYGIKPWRDDPYHAHPWTRGTLRRFLNDEASCGLGKGRKWELKEFYLCGSGFPWWHLSHRLGINIPSPVGMSIIDFVAQKQAKRD